MFQIKKIPALNVEALSTASVILEELPAQLVVCNNWATLYPYSPQVTFRMAHNGRTIFIRFDVSEKYTSAKVDSDNGKVWTDSCVELFIAVDDKGYYNCEFSCIGKALLGYRETGEKACHATPEIMQSIKRFSSLGTQNFDERQGDNRWQLTIAIPATAFFRHKLPSLSGKQAKINVYKCGDALSEPHFLSWQPITMPNPTFHVPQFFTEIEFQK